MEQPPPQLPSVVPSVESLEPPKTPGRQIAEKLGLSALLVGGNFHNVMGAIMENVPKTDPWPLQQEFEWLYAAIFTKPELWLTPDGLSVMAGAASLAALSIIYKFRRPILHGIGSILHREPKKPTGSAAGMEVYSSLPTEMTRKIGRMQAGRKQRIVRGLEEPRK